MTDETPNRGDNPRRARHGNGDGDDIRRRFALDDDAAAPARRHRRRRAPGDPTTTGSIPVVRTDPELPEPTEEYRRPERPAYSPNPYLEIDYSQSSFGPIEVRYRSTEPPVTPAPAPQQQQPEPPRAEPPRAEPRRAQPQRIEPQRAEPQRAEPQRPAPPSEPPTAAMPVPPVSEPETAPVRYPVRDQPPAAEYGAAEYETGERESAAPPTLPEPVAPPAAPAFDILDDAVDEQPRTEVVAHAGGWGPLAEQEPTAFAEYDPPPGPAPDPAVPTILEAESDEEAAADGERMPARHRNRKAVLALLAVAAVIIVVAVLGLRAVGVFDSRKDFDSTTGGTHALVHIPENASLKSFGDILADAGVVGSRRAFVDAADGRALSAGYYDLPTGISAQTAVTMMEGNDHRVGRIVIPDGLQLDSKEGADGTTTPGIFALLSEATTMDAGDDHYGVSTEQLQQAAAGTSAAELGVPEWATAPVDKLTGDYRRIEGLIAPGTWEDIDPRLSATEMLKDLISRSSARLETWGLLTANESGLLPYDALIVASIVEREVKHADDYPKVARVILNRLARDQQLQMDSTVNYTAAITDIDVHGDNYQDANAWNTYQRDGLPVTPIGAIGERALQAVEKPAQGKWLYFVTVDEEGTTLFANTFAKHKQNRQVACENKLLSVGCE